MRAHMWTLLFALRYQGLGGSSGLDLGKSVRELGLDYPRDGTPALILETQKAQRGRLTTLAGSQC